MENKTKLRILYLYQYLIKNTDPDHPKSTVELMKMLQDKHNIKVSRNTISDDLLMLHNCDLQIKIIHSTQNKYYFDGQYSRKENGYVAKYSNPMFHIHDTEPSTEVTLLCKASNVKDIIDNFGLNIDTMPIDNDNFYIKAIVCTNLSFYSWIFSFDGSVKIIEPKNIVEEYKELLRLAIQRY